MSNPLHRSLTGALYAGPSITLTLTSVPAARRNDLRLLRTPDVRVVLAVSLREVETDLPYLGDRAALEAEAAAAASRLLQSAGYRPFRARLAALAEDLVRLAGPLVDARARFEAADRRARQIRDIYDGPSGRLRSEDASQPALRWTLGRTGWYREHPVMPEARRSAIKAEREEARAALAAL